MEKELEDAFTERVYDTPEDGVIEFSSFLSVYSIELDDKPCIEEIRNVRNASVENNGKQERSRRIWTTNNDWKKLMSTTKKSKLY